MATDYTALDAAILEHLRIGKGHPKNSRTCQEVAIRTHPGWYHAITIANRLQALRKAGTIQYDRGAPKGGWILVEPSTYG